MKMSDFDLFKDLENTTKKYSTLKIQKRRDELILSGEIELIHPTEFKIIDNFSVLMEFPKAYPHCFPRVWETSKKIERVADRHVYPKEGNLCLAVTVEEQLTCRVGISTIWFIERVLIPRLAEEHVVNNGGNYAHEFAHGLYGSLEFYSKKFKVKAPFLVIELLKRIREYDFPKHYDGCPCGSGRKFKRCHKILFTDLHRLGHTFLTSEIHKMEQLLRLMLK